MLKSWSSPYFQWAGNNEKPFPERLTLGGSRNIWSKEINSKLGNNSMNWLKESSFIAWHRTRVRSTSRVHLEWSAEEKRCISWRIPVSLFITPFPDLRGIFCISILTATSTITVPNQAPSTALTKKQNKQYYEQKTARLISQLFMQYL